MRWTDMDEKEMIKAWAAEEYSEEIQREYLPQPDVCRESYWADYDNGGNLAEYGFGAVPEFVGMLQKELGAEYYKDLILPLAVAAFKEKEIILEEAGKAEGGHEAGEKADGLLIPDFVYVF
jgi:hypothetical protein